MKLELYYVVTKVRPLPEHPLYWDTQFGYFSVFVLATGESDAMEKSNRFLAIVPYEVVGDRCEVSLAAENEWEPGSRLDVSKKEGIRSGFGAHVFLLSIGTDEEEFEQLFQPHEPT